MTHLPQVVALSLAVAAAPGAAEVVKTSPVGFETRHVVTIAAPADRVWRTLVAPGRWWSSDHTYSGSAANLSLAPRAGGCWCERTGGGGSVEHMRVVQVQPGKLLRMIGGLGPLQREGATGALTITLAPADGGTTRVTFNYVVGGFMAAGADTLAAPVDKVLGIQVERLKDAAASR